jgi:hypothetical protein
MSDLWSLGTQTDGCRAAATGTVQFSMTSFSGDVTCCSMATLDLRR